jgi:hypothetical protein
MAHPTPKNHQPETINQQQVTSNQEQNSLDTWQMIFHSLSLYHFLTPGAAQPV